MPQLVGRIPWLLDSCLMISYPVSITTPLWAFRLSKVEAVRYLSRLHVRPCHAARSLSSSVYLSTYLTHILFTDFLTLILPYRYHLTHPVKNVHWKPVAGCAPARENNELISVEKPWELFQIPNLRRMSNNVLGRVSDYFRVKDHFDPSLLLLISQQRIEELLNLKSLGASTVWHLAPGRIRVFIPCFVAMIALGFLSRKSKFSLIDPGAH